MCTPYDPCVNISKCPRGFPSFASRHGASCVAKLSATPFLPSFNAFSFGSPLEKFHFSTWFQPAGMAQSTKEGDKSVQESSERELFLSQKSVGTPIFHRGEPPSAGDAPWHYAHRRYGCAKSVSSAFAVLGGPSLHAFVSLLFMVRVGCGAQSRLLQTGQREPFPPPLSGLLPTGS